MEEVAPSASADAPHPATNALIAASAAGDLEQVLQLLSSGCPAYAQAEADGRSALMAAAAGGHESTVRALLAAGAPWNAVDRRGHSAGNYALDASQQRVVDLLVDEAVRAELVLGAAERRTLTAKRNAAYLSRGVRYDGERLIDADDDAVMMEWEAPLMETHADRLCAAGGDVLNVGFGMGIVDSAIARRAPRSHTIIEAHPDVYARMEREGWTSRPGVRVLFGRWQEVLPAFEGPCFDAVFYDTYGEHDADMADFHDELPRILRRGGVYSFFNGLCPFNVFFQGVACAVVQLELQALGFTSTFEAMPVHVPDEHDEQWAQIRRKYYFSDTYYLPHCVLDGGNAEKAADDAAEEGDDVPPAVHFANLNPSLMTLLARSLRGGAEDAKDLQRLLADEVMPHMEAAGWRVALAFASLWAAAAEGQPLAAAARDAAAALDANSAALLAHAVQLSLGEAGGAAIDELQLALVPNPLAADDSPVGGDSPADRPTAAAAGSDASGRTFSSAEDFWAAECAGDAAAWYQGSAEFWRREAPTVRGMMGGLDELHAADVAASAAFVGRLRAAAPPLPQGVALDCGAGIGRVCAHVLLDHFDAVELLEPSEAFVHKARESLPAARVLAVHVTGLESFVPPAGRKYACVWVQWVLNYLTDADLVAFFRRCAAALAPSGCIVVKESCSRDQNGFYVDRSDNSITRTAPHFRRCFEAAQLQIVAEETQPHLPREVFPVQMWALRA
ncbi:hypothetical protein AB1Y20_006770 [Prymnesium parvum]|uniref:RMT2 domain-containing protein n=1 Tax=Prymnesium parvum TaxID=97485 RepID=A0AB34IYP0_PRYPA